MKIGIVTFQRADNQGALLQCYALYSYLKKLERNTEVIDYRNNNIEKAYKIFPISKNIKLMARKWLKGIRRYGELKKRHENFERLRKKISFSPSINISDIRQGKAEYDLIISGSDQVWNTDITRGFDDVYYLNFPGEHIRASYAASIGSTGNPDFAKDYFKNKLSALDRISVREKDAAEFISQKTSKPALQCIDPTLLLDRSEWEKLSEETDLRLPERYILLYYVQPNPELLKIAEKLAKERNIPVVCFEKSVKLGCEMIYNTTAGPAEFVKLIRNAETVVTSSFHATAFSCIFSRDIHIIAHSVTGSRVVSLTEMFGIENRIHSSYQDFEKKYSPDKKPEYNRDEFMAQLQKSENYLKELIILAGGKANE